MTIKIVTGQIATIFMIKYSYVLEELLVQWFSQERSSIKILSEVKLKSFRGESFQFIIKKKKKPPSSLRTHSELYTSYWVDIQRAKYFTACCLNKLNKTDVWSTVMRKSSGPAKLYCTYRSTKGEEKKSSVPISYHPQQHKWGKNVCQYVSMCVCYILCVCSINTWCMWE